MEIWKGNPDLRGLLWPLTAYDLDPDNARLHPSDNLTAIRQSLEAFGQAAPVTLWRKSSDSRPIVIGGNGTTRAARESGWTHLAATMFIGSPIRARALALALNRIPELAQWDQDLYAQQMEMVGAQWAAEAEKMNREPVAPSHEPTVQTLADAVPKKPPAERRPKVEPAASPTPARVEPLDVEVSPVITPGDVYRIDNRILICADGLDIQLCDRAFLMSAVEMNDGRTVERLSPLGVR